MSVAASRPSPVVTAPTPVAAPTPPDREPAPHPFSELLRQNRAVERARSEAPKVATPPVAASVAGGEDAAATNDDSATPLSDGAPRSDAARAKARAGAGTPRAATPAASHGERSEAKAEKTPTQDAEDEERRTADAASPASTPTHAVQADASRAAEAELRLGAAARRAALSTVADGTDANAGRSGANALSAAEGGAEHDVAARRGGATATGRADSRIAAQSVDAAATAANPFAQLLGESRSADRAAIAAMPLVEASPLSSAISASAPAPQASGAAESVASSPSATLPVPIDSPDFAAAFGVQVSVFVKEGVQRAELHLNPAETGPVSIAITLEGTQAHVAFGADLAATRAAIEDGLPALASALRDAGFTLAGGGVAEHSRPNGGHGGDHPSGRSPTGRRGAIEDDAPGATAAVRHAARRIATGGIDLYA